MKKQTIILCMLWVVFTLSVKAQQDPQFSQSMFTQFQFNPGAAGSHDKVCVNAINRQQWMGFGDGSPVTSAFTIDAAIRPFGINSGVGLTIMRDEFGFNDDIGLKLTYAYRLTLSTGLLGIGVSGGVYNKSIEAEWYVPEGNQSLNPANDPAIPDNESAMAMDFNFGLYYSTDKMYVGLSSTHVNEARFEYEKGEPMLNRHYYVMAGYNVLLSNPQFEFMPSSFIQTDGATTVLSVSGLLKYNKKVWGGVSYRTDNAITAMAGVTLFDWVNVGYSYDFITATPLRSVNDGTHELMLGFCFDVKKDKSPKKYKSVRFL